MKTLLQNARYSLRLVRKNPGFSAVAVITLALGIGANSAIFSVIYGVMLAPLPYKNPDQLERTPPGAPSADCSIVSVRSICRQLPRLRSRCSLQPSWPATSLRAAPPASIP